MTTCSSVAQSVERAAVNRHVVGSSPARGATIYNSSPFPYFRNHYPLRSELKQNQSEHLKWKKIPIFFLFNDYIIPNLQTFLLSIDNYCSLC